MDRIPRRRPGSLTEMANSAAFEWVCKELDRETNLSELEARGTVRIALRNAGLEAAAVTRAQIAVVVKQVLPRELVARAIDDAEMICEKIGRALKESTFTEEGSAESSPEDVFRRLARS